MSDGLADLTEKEKDALRLLLSGHDAKSSAAALNISVHTVNDRLRNARQKLGVSSSREAARILGNAEGQAPQNSAHASLGIDGSKHGTDTANLTNTQPRRSFGLTWLAGGMLIMSLVIAAAVILTLNYSPDEAGSNAAETEESFLANASDNIDSPASLTRAEEFLGLVDASDWNGSWDAAGPFFQSQVTADQWSSQVEPVRAPLGDVKSRELANVDRTSTLPGAPAGEYEVLQFRTSFAGMDGLATETVVMLKGEGGWEIVGYFIRPGG